MKLKTLTAISILFLFGFKTPEKTSNVDLRTFETVLSIDQVNAEKYQLQKSSAGQYFLSRLNKKKNSIYKLSSEKAKLIDESFVESFIHLKYMMPAYDKKCEVQYSLFMRGEEAKICHKEKSKINKSIKIVSLFKKYF